MEKKKTKDINEMAVANVSGGRAEGFYDAAVKNNKRG